MDVWGITLATLRRWYVFLPIMALAGLLAYAAGQNSAPEYEATGTAMYTPARLTPDRTTQAIANPFGSEDGANSAITVILNGPDTAALLAERGLDGTATTTAASRSPIFTVRALASNSDTALAIVDEIMVIASDELTKRQEDAGIEPQYMIGLQELAPASITQVDNNTAIRVQAVILALGAVVAIALAVLFDDIVGLIRRRRRRRRGGSTQEGRDSESGTRDDVKEEAPDAARHEDGSQAGSTDPDAVVAAPAGGSQPQVATAGSRRRRNRTRKRGRAPVDRIEMDEDESIGQPGDEGRHAPSHLAGDDNEIRDDLGEPSIAPPGPGR